MGRVTHAICLVVQTCVNSYWPATCDLWSQATAASWHLVDDLFTGPIKKVLRVTGCRNLTIVCIAKRVIIQDCVDCQFYLVSPNPPLLSHSCRDITFAPYNVYYQGRDTRVICFINEKYSKKQTKKLTNHRLGARKLIT